MSSARVRVPLKPDTSPLFRLPTMLHPTIGSLLDDKALARFGDTCRIAHRLALIAGGDKGRFTCTYSLVLLSRPYPYKKGSSIWNACKPEHLASIMNNTYGLHFYSSESQASSYGRDHSWYKFYMGYAIVSYVIRTCALEDKLRPYCLQRANYPLVVLPRSLRILELMDYRNFRSSRMHEKSAEEKLVRETMSVRRDIPVSIDPILDQLQHAVISAQRNYAEHFQNSKISLLHRQPGQDRARQLTQAILHCDLLRDALQILAAHFRDRNNASLRPHSFDTLLLKEMVKSCLLRDIFKITNITQSQLQNVHLIREHILLSLLRIQYTNKLVIKNKDSVCPIEDHMASALRVEVIRYLDAESVCLLLCASPTFRSHAVPFLWETLCADRKISVPSGLTAKSMFKQQLNPTKLFVKHLNGTTIDVTINSLTTLGELKARVTKKTNAIHKKTPIEASELRLITGGRQLDGDDTLVLRKLDPKAEGIMHCILRMRPELPARKCTIM